MYTQYRYILKISRNNFFRTWHYDIVYRFTIKKSKSNKNNLYLSVLLKEQKKNSKKGGGGKTAVAVKKKERIWKRGKNLVPKLSNILDMKEGGTTKWWEWNYLLSLLTLVLRVKPKNLDHERNTLHFSRYFCRIFLNFLSNFV